MGGYPPGELTYPLKSPCWRWFSELPQVGYVILSLEGMYPFPFRVLQVLTYSRCFLKAPWSTSMNRLVFSPQVLHQRESKMHESWRQCYKWHFWNLPKKGNPSKLSKSFLRFQSCCFFVVCACFFLMRVGFVLYIFWGLNVEGGRFFFFYWDDRHPVEIGAGGSKMGLGRLETSKKVWGFFWFQILVFHRFN